MIGLQEHITFKEDTHQYFDPSGEEYTSVSRILRLVTPDFDKKAVSGFMAKKMAKEEGISIDQAQHRILNEWEEAKDYSIDHGNFIHNNLEAYLKSGTCDAKVISAGKRILSFLSSYYRYYPEAILYSGKHKAAGTADLPVQRQRKRDGVWDFYDFKTNVKKGIYFDSIKRMDGKIEKHYNRFLKAPLDHLEDSNYNTYCLQLSIYAYMAETTFGAKVGRLGIIFIGKDMSIKMYPVPYMRFEAIALLEAHLSIVNASWDE